MSHLRLVSSRPESAPASRRQLADPPSLEAFRREFDYVIRTLRRLGVPADDLEDLAQEVFIVLHRTWDVYDPTRPLRAYLFGIAFRVASAHLRKRKREVLHAVIEINEVAPGADDATEARQRRTLILNALERIPLQNRAVLIMHDIDELPMAEIASSLSILRFTGYSRLRRARKELAVALASLRCEGKR